MDRQVNEIELVERAQRGDRQSLNTLAQIARERLRTYVYRLTQKDDLTQEIVQESLLEMCKILGKLQKTDRFWSWLYGIATNKLHRHYRTEKARKNVAASEERRRGSMSEREEGFEGLVGDELKSIISGAMQKLRTRHKAVLVMRCYDNMAYSEIAESMGCSEFSTRMLFVRAKKALQKELLNKGFGRGSLLAALIVFGKMTAPSKAAAAQLTVPAAALNVGLAAGVAGLATSTTGIVSLAAAGALTVGTVAATSGPGRPAINPFNTGVQAVSPYATPVEAHEQYWFGFPEGPQGPMMLRAQSGGSTSRVLQNEEANYSYSNGVVAINNHRMWLSDMSVFKLPIDSKETRGFLALVEGIDNDIQPVSATKGKGLVVVVERAKGKAAAETPWTISSRNVLDTDYFQSDWPTNARIVDNRDAMHRQGWTCFRVRGRVAGREVAGAGRMPLVYGVCKEHQPWLRLTIGDLAVVDGGTAATMQNAQGELPVKFRQGAFFSGLARPWMGLHTLDTVRRDAALQRARFETRLLPGGREAQVAVTSEKTQLLYTVDIEADLIRRIEFTVDNAPAGSLEFEYLPEANLRSSEFTAPVNRNERVTLDRDPGMLWLVQLANGVLGR